MKRKYWCIGLIGVVLLLIGLTFIPRVTDSFKGDVTPTALAEYPQLHQAYLQLLEDNSLSQITLEDTLKIATVENLWSRCEYYILPCYITDLNTVPHAGSTDWSAAVHLLIACSNEDSMAAKLCSMEVCEFTLEMEPGANTFISAYADVLPLNIRTEDPRAVTFQDSVDCLREPRISVFYSVATAESAQQREVETQSSFDWWYSIYCCGIPIAAYHQSVCQDYIVNA